MTNQNLITVTEFGQFAPEVDQSKYDQPTISGMISQASQQVTDYLQYSPLAESIVGEIRDAKVTSDGDLLIFPAKLPIVSVSAIDLIKGATTVTLNLTDGSGVAKYNIDYARRHIRFPYGEVTMEGYPTFTDFFALRGTQFYVKLSYIGGWAPSALPAVIKQATVLFMRDIMAVSFNQSGATRISQGSISMEYQNIKGESNLVKNAKRLLNPYRRIM